MIAIDLSRGSSGETILPDSFEGINASEAVQSMAATADPTRLYSGMSLRALAEASNPYQLSDSLRNRLAQQSSDMLAKITQWALEDL